ncbi:MAG: hypothetical protein KDE27_03055, partial [Planctomycetes bacterium]|nr:hypothetical protein [Planctomycetota bacterium]
KIGFGRAGAMLVPLLGHGCSRSYPISFRLVGADDADVERHGDRFVIHHRGLHTGIEERWDLTPDQVEQSFVLAAAPAADELRIGAATDLTFAGHGSDGLVFRGEGEGRVLYGDAVAIEADGRRTTLSTRFDAGVIRIGVPQGLTYPLVVDPVVAVVDVALDEVADNKNPDVAHHVAGNTWAVVMEERVSTLDTDVKVRRFDAAGNVTDTDFLELGSAIADHPVIACAQGTGTFVSVWEEGLFDLMGRPLGAANASPGGVNVVQAGTPALGLTVTQPAIAGSEFDKCLVTYVENAPATVPFLMFETLNNAAVGSNRTTLTSSAGCLSAAVAENRAPSHEWVVAITDQILGCGAGDIQFIVVDLQGAITHPLTTVTGALLDDDRRADVAWNGSEGLIVWDRDQGSYRDIMGRIVRRTAAGYGFVGGERNLSQLEPGTTASVDRYAPRVATDGVRFVYCYEEGSNGNIFAASVGRSGTALLFHEGHMPVMTNGQDHDGRDIEARMSGVTTQSRFFVVADERDGINDHDVGGVLFDGLAAGSTLAAVQTGCQPIGGVEPAISVTGTAAVGGTFTVTSSGHTGAPVLVFGIPQTPQTLCSYFVTRRCQQGVALPPMNTIFGTRFSIIIPVDTAFVGLRLAAQSIDLLANGACSANLFGVPFATSDTIVATVR